MNEETIFHAALARPNPSERAAFLDGVCFDKPELRASVEALLAAHEASGPFLNPVVPNRTTTIASDSGQERGAPAGAESSGGEESRPAASMTVDFPSPARTDVLFAGRYTLQEKIGEGGMGEVWVAKQLEPVKRKVALKLIKTGMDSRAVLQRFEQERQALAILDHPNIAKVLDAGMTPSGLPFFVMELVNGLPLTRFCDEARLTTTERLELFVTICQAVQHAHHKGIVHRDLKPANILVTIIDGRPVPKVIDFGVAKATGGKLTDESMSTQFGAVVGTLEYMSPEQAGYSGMDVDTRADIYSLGVILYELLTGLRPIDAKRLKKAALTEMIRLIQEEEPAKPSTRLSTNASLPSIAAQRQIEPRKLMALLRGELDWVVMKCLEKHRDRRYETANGLAKDIQRYLANEPVDARPPSARYRVGKFLKRNRGPVLAGAMVSAAIMAGLVAVFAVQARANRALAIKNRDLLEAQAKVQARYDLAVEAIKTFHTGVSEDFLLKQEQFKSVRDRLLKSASDFYGRLSALLGRESDGASQRALAQANFEVAELTEKVGTPADALAAHRQVLAARQALVSKSPADPELSVEHACSLASIAYLLSTTGQTKEAEATFRAAETALVALAPVAATAAVPARLALARCRSDLGWLLHSTGRENDAMSVLGLASADLDALVAGGGAPADSRQQLASVITKIAYLKTETGKLAEAEAEFRRALAIRQRLVDDDYRATQFQRDLAMSHNSLGRLLTRTGKTHEAEARYRTAVEIEQKLADENPAVSDFRSNLAGTRSDLGNLLWQMGRSAEAEAEFKKALVLAQKLSDDNPAITFFRISLAAMHDDLGSLQAQTGQSAAARESYERARAIQQKLADENPTVTHFSVSLANNHANMGWLLNRSGKSSEAEIEYRKALAIEEKLVDLHPGATVMRNSLATTYLNFAGQQFDSGRLDQALDLYQRALTIQQKLADDDPSELESRYQVGECYFGIAKVQTAKGKLNAAKASVERMLAIQTKLAERNPAVTKFRQRQVQAYTFISFVSSHLSDLRGALEMSRRALEIGQKLADDSPGQTDVQRALVGCRNNLADALRKLHRFAEARDCYDRALAIGEPLAREHPENSWYVTGPLFSLRGRGSALFGLGDLAGSATDIRRALALWERISTHNGELWFENACCHATLSALAGRPGSDVPASEGPGHAEQAIAALRHAYVQNYRETCACRYEPVFDHLGDRSDFQAILLDFSFPIDPFGS